MSIKKKYYIPETILGLGCLGLLEMIIAGLNWHTLMQNDAYAFFRPGHPGAQIAVLLLVFGFVGMLMWFGGLFFTSTRKRVLRNALAVVHTVEFFAVVFLYRGV